MEPHSQKKAQIVQAAFSVAMEQGVQNLRFEIIAKTAGLSRQLLRYYFEDQEALMIALCDHMADVYRQALIAGAAKAENTKRLDFFFDFYFDLLADQRKPRDDQAYDAMFAFAASSQPIRKNLQGQYGLVGHVLSHEIQISYPTLTAQDCLELSYLFVCLMYGHWKMVATLGYSEDHKFITRRAMDRLIHSYVSGTHAPLRELRPFTSDP